MGYIMVRLTPIELDKYAIVDIEDSDLAFKKWYTSSKSLYAKRSDKTKAFMHRIILERVIGRPLERHEYVDHVDGNGLNNRRFNLRIATPHQNQLNKSGRGTSHFRGVSFNADTQKWAVQIHYDDLSSYLGVYDDEVTAAQVYDAAAHEYLDTKFVKFNFPNQTFKLSDFGITKDPKTGRPKVELVKSQTGYRGVEFSPLTGKYATRISFNNTSFRQGLYDSPEEAARVYDAAARHYLGEKAILNFPDEKNTYNPRRFLLQSHNTSGYRGVTKHGNKWRSMIEVNKSKFRLGNFNDPIDAAKAYDEAALKHLGNKARLNFPDSPLSFTANSDTPVDCLLELST